MSDPVIKKLAERVNDTEAQLWSEIEQHLAQSGKPEDLSTYLVELSDGLEHHVNNETQQFFDTRIRSAAIMLQTLVGKSLALEAENNDLRAQIQGVAEKEPLGEYLIHGRPVRVHSHQAGANDWILRIPGPTEEEDILVVLTNKNNVLKEIAKLENRIAELEGQDSAFALRVPGTKNHVTVTCNVDATAALENINKYLKSFDTERDLYSTQADVIADRDAKIKQLKIELDDARIQNERWKIASESDKKLIHVQRDTLEKVKIAHKELRDQVCLTLGKEPRGTNAEVLEVLGRTLDGILSKEQPAPNTKTDPFAELDKPTPPIIVHDYKSSQVDHPRHYNAHPSGVECITVVEHMSFNIGNAVKYLWRAGEKGIDGPREDFEKAVWYIRREIERLEKLGYDEASDH